MFERCRPEYLADSEIIRCAAKVVNALEADFILAFRILGVLHFLRGKLYGPVFHESVIFRQRNHFTIPLLHEVLLQSLQVQPQGHSRIPS